MLPAADAACGFLPIGVCSGGMPSFAASRSTCSGSGIATPPLVLEGRSIISLARASDEGSTGSVMPSACLISFATTNIDRGMPDGMR